MVTIATGKFSTGNKKPENVKASPATKPPKKKKHVGKIILLVFLSLILVLMLGVVAYLSYFGVTPDDHLILNNITVMDTHLGGMTREEASATLHQMTDSTYSQQDMVLNVNGTEIRFAPSDTGAMVNVDALVETAYSHGRTGKRADRDAIRAELEVTPFEIQLMDYVTLNTDAIRTILESHKELFQSEYIPSSAEAKGDMPVLDAADENFDPEAKCQTLVLTIGNPGRNISMDDVFNQIMEAYSRNEFLVVIDTTEENQDPEPLDLNAIFEAFCTEYVDAHMDTTTFEVIPEVYGYTFDLEEAAEKLETTGYGGVIEIPFRLVAPTVNAESLEALLFRDVLATYSTKHTSNKARNNNLELACAAINGKILNPGEVFDYNTTLGKRTKEAGYKAAPAYNGGATVNELGGGICQVSSTLYYCTLLADLKIVTRTAHSYVSNYIPYGMDATVSWGGPEFQFANNTNYPIRLEASVSGGYVHISIIGTDEKDYYVEMEYDLVGMYKPEEVIQTMTASEAAAAGYKNGQVIQTAYTGYSVNTYKVKYSKETKEEISREKEAYSKYKSRDKITVSVVPDPTQPTTPPATTPPTEAATLPTEATMPPLESMNPGISDTP